jgi:hypothetical protein
MNDVNNLQETLSGMLDIYLHGHINFDFWEEMDELDRDSIDVIEGFIHTTFEDIMGKYPRIENLLVECRTDIHKIVMASMSLPFPVNPEYYIQRVCENVMNHFDDFWYDRLSDAVVPEEFKSMSV